METIHKNSQTWDWNTLFRSRNTDNIKRLDCSGESINEIHISSNNCALLTQPRRPRIAVIGTRDPSPYGREYTMKIVSMLAQSSLNPVIISGLAMGVDTIAHRSALSNGLQTVAVLPTGIDTIYPLQNRELAEKIQEDPGSALLTQFPEKTAPMAINFLARNYVIATLSDLVIVVESKVKGGAIVTARYASEYNIPVIALPGRVDDLRSQGCNELIREGIATMCPPETKFIEFIESFIHQENDTRLIRVDWDDDGAMMPKEISIPNSILDDDVADYLSDTYDFCVNSWHEI